jgi:hypothetical protein
VTGLASTGGKMSKERATCDRFGFSRRKAVKRKRKSKRDFPLLLFLMALLISPVWFLGN